MAEAVQDPRHHSAETYASAAAICNRSMHPKETSSSNLVPTCVIGYEANDLYRPARRGGCSQAAFERGMRAWMDTLLKTKPGSTGLRSRLQVRWILSVTYTVSPVRRMAPEGPAKAYCPKTGLSVLLVRDMDALDPSPRDS
jgi:hypothetical protein